MSGSKVNLVRFLITGACVLLAAGLLPLGHLMHEGLARVLIQCLVGFALLAGLFMGLLAFSEWISPMSSGQQRPTRGPRDAPLLERPAPPGAAAPTASAGPPRRPRRAA